MSVATDKYFYYQIGKPEEKADYGDLYYFSQAILVLESKVTGLLAGQSTLISTTLPSGEIFVGNAANIATAVPMSGDVSIINTGATTVLAILGNAIPADAAGALTNDGAGNLTWTPAAAGGITTLNTLVAAVQTFSKVDDTNMSLTITSAAADHQFALTWAGTLADGRIASAAAWNAKQNAITLTTLGTSGAATFIANTLNIPDYTATAPALTQNEIAFGDAANLMTSSPDLTWNNATNTLTLTGTIGMLVSNSANVFYAAQGNVGFWYTGAASTGLLSHQGFGIDFDAGRNLYTVGDVGITNNTHIEVDDVAQTIELTSVSTITASNLAGVGTRMVTASAAGVLATAAIPGGMTNPMTTLGDIIYEDAVPTPVRLAGNITANRQFLSQVGTGAISAAPIWVRIDAGDIASGILPANFGGTGISNNVASTLTISGAFALTLTLTGATGVTLPTTGTLATLAGAESLTNKKLGSLTTNGFVKTSGGDGTLSVDANSYLRVFATSITNASHTGSTAETLLASVLIPANTVAVGNIIEIKSRYTKTGTAGGITGTIRIHTSAALAGNSIGIFGLAASVRWFGNTKAALIKTTTNTEIAPAGASNNDWGTANGTTAISTYNIDWTVDQYIVYSVTLVNGADTGTLSGYVITIQ